MSAKATHVELASVAEVTSGQSAPQDRKAFGNTGRPFIRAGSLEGLLNGQSEDELEHISDEMAARFRMKLFPPDTIVFAKSGMSAKIGRVYRLRGPCYVVSHLAAVIPSEDLIPGYAQRWFEINPPSRLIPNSAYPSIRVSTIAALSMPLPPPAEQSRIAAILDKADGIRRKRAEAIRLASDFLTSTFYDMFGDPESNHRGFPEQTIRDLVSEVRYGTSKKAGPHGEFPILRMGNVTYDGHLDLSDLKYINLESKEVPKYTTQDGDILFNRTNSKDLVGKTAVFRGDRVMAIAGYLIRARVNNKALPDYISGYLNSAHGKAKLRHICKNIVGMANINAQEFQDIPIVVPPLQLQERYAQIVDRSAEAVAVQQKHMAECDRLYASLTQRAFDGGF